MFIDPSGLAWRDVPGGVATAVSRGFNGAGIAISRVAGAMGITPGQVKATTYTVIDQGAQIAAEGLTNQYIGSVAGSILKKGNFVLGILDPFPQSAEAPTLSSI